MNGEEQDIERVLRTAIATEWEGYAFYRTLAKRTESDLGRQMFERLAQDEVEHVRVLEEVSCAYKDGCVIMDYEEALEHIDCEVDFDAIDEEASCTETAPVFKRGVDRAEAANDIDALRIAVESERAAIEHYAEAAQSAEAEDVRSFFEHLVEIEEGHERLLQAEYDYYAANGFYFDMREFSLEM